MAGAAVDPGAKVKQLIVSIDGVGGASPTVLTYASKLGIHSVSNHWESNLCQLFYGPNSQRVPKHPTGEIIRALLIQSSIVIRQRFLLTKGMFDPAGRLSLR